MKKKEEDIFDILMEFPVLRNFNPFYKKNKEILLYLFFGGIGFLLNFFLFVWIENTFYINELINNIICWIICVFFQFFTNRKWVFNTKSDIKPTLFKQILSFFSGRLITLVLEELILWIFVTYLGFNAVIVKLVAQVIVIILNYIFSKFFVFKK